MLTIKTTSYFDTCKVELELDRETAELLKGIAERINQEEVEELLYKLKLPVTWERVELVMKLLCFLESATV